MPLYSFKNLVPTISKSVFIAPSADVIGDARIENDVSVWHNCVVRADVNSISIGKNTNIQDLSMLHVTKDFTLIIGEGVSVGHSVTLHGCTIGNNCLIGMGAIILDGAIIGANSVVAAGALVPPGKIFPTGSMIMGNPAVLKRELNASEKLLYGNHYINYIDYKNDYLNPELVKLI